METKPHVIRIEADVAERMREDLSAPWPRISTNGQYYVEAEPYRLWVASQSTSGAEHE